jgi:ribulose-phosphate 3-epimerase
MNTPLISISILGADWLKFGEAIDIAVRAKADLLQIDIADGVFTPTITFGEELVKRIKEVTNIPIEVHLMVSRPQDWIPLMSEIGVEFVLFHVEAVQRVHATIDLIKRFEMGVGLVLNSETRPEVVEYLLPYIDLVTLMAIIPGWSGQKFIPETIVKINKLREIIDKSKNPNVLIEVDGGISKENALDVIEAGADILIASSSIYKQKDPLRAAFELKDRINNSSNDQRRHRIQQFLKNIK